MNKNDHHVASHTAQLRSEGCDGVGCGNSEEDREEPRNKGEESQPCHGRASGQLAKTKRRKCWWLKKKKYIS